MSLDLDQRYYNEGYEVIVGTDEAGRGCLLGPVFAAAVILPRDFTSPLINDSKKLSQKKRQQAFEMIAKHALAYTVASVEATEIDKINILNASRLAMQKAIAQLNHEYDLILTDALEISSDTVPVVAVIHGDTLSQSIAAASIVAKVSRDRYCEKLAIKYPLYHIDKNKGYATKQHLDALKRYGPIKHLHRFSYGPVKACLYKKVPLL
ncbi:MAG: ribonuclease HII [Erysipelotrichia bacterium]|nr:ribonuclease HII [Erysipelotrichia bacterium]